MRDAARGRPAGFHNAELAQPEMPSRASLVAGWLLCGLPALFLLFGGATALMRSPEVVDGLRKVEFPADLLPVLAALEFLCAVLLLIPRTAVLGALLFAAYCGGAVACHARLHQAQWIVPVVMAATVWVGLLLRRPGLRRLILSAYRGWA